MQKIIYATSLLIFCLVSQAFSQITFSDNQSATQLATALSTNGYTISNPIITNGTGQQVAIYSNGLSIGLELDEGILLTTSTASVAFSTDPSVDSNEFPQNETTYNDPDLVAIDPEANEDPIIFEFDFTIAGTEPKVFALDYQFASDEYPEFVCSEFNDVFGFFVSGGDLPMTSNLASARGRNVAINSINPGVIGGSGNSTGVPCDFNNTDFYVDNTTATVSFVFDGLTTTLRAYTILRPGISYHMKMALADTEDFVIDSGIFIAPIQVFDIPPKSYIDFDGVDDYIDTSSVTKDLEESTLAAWIKLDDTFSNDGVICGETNFMLLTDALGRLKVSAITDAPSLVSLVTPDVSAPILDKNLWHHVAASYDGSSGELKLFLNGEEVWTGNGLGTKLATNSSDFAIGRNSENLNNYFNGDIDEVRVYKSSLINEQIQKQVYQSIENINGKVAGEEISKPIDNGSLDWESLLLYYNMNLIYDRVIIDVSSSIKNGLINNITSIQSQTAPIPYTANASGSWTEESTWLHGDVWDIEDLPNKDWAIVKITDNALVTTNQEHDLLGLIIETGSELQIQDDKLLNNTSYLELNGTIDLLGESQLIQTYTSDLALTSSGQIRRRQQGQSSIYRYNYWSSPVGQQSTTQNNSNFELSMLKDANGFLQFTNDLSPPISTPATLSTAWSNTFRNGVTYYDWGLLNESTGIEPGVGYIHKGSGVGSTNFEYLFEGKPHNGIIQLSVNDVGGPGSVASESKTQYLFGNPYASAIDSHQFIDDNAGVTGGALYFWEQWGGDTHTLEEYQGGYSTLTKLGAVRAYQFIGLEGGNNGSPDGTILPGRYIPVAQGFMTEITGTGMVEFNNNQRAFVTETSADSQFFRANNNNQTTSQIQTIRLEFTTENNLNRELLIGFSEDGTEGYDYGYDAIVNEIYDNDLVMRNNNQNYVIQFLPPIAPENEISLFMQTLTPGNYNIKASEINNIDLEQEVYLYDYDLNVYHDLKNNTDYSFSSLGGNTTERFKIVFKQDNILSQDDDVGDRLVILVNDNKLFIKQLNTDVDELVIVDVFGKEVNKLNSINFASLEAGVSIGYLKSGVYIVKIHFNNVELTKKIVIN